MSETPLAPDAFEYELRRLLAEKRRQRLAKFDRNALAWLALVPAWNEQLAHACNFPEKERLRDFVDETQAAGLCQVNQSTNPERSTWYTAYVYTAFAPYLPPSRQNDALNFVQQIPDTRLRAQSLAKLAPHLTNELVPRLLEAAQKIEDPIIRATPLLVLLPHLAEEQRLLLLDELLAVMPQISSTEERLEFALKLIPHTVGVSRSSLTTFILDSLKDITSEVRQVSILIDLIPHLTAQAFDAIIEFARTFTKSVSEAQVYIALATHEQAEPKWSVRLLNEAYLMIDYRNLDIEPETRQYLLSVLASALARSGLFERALTVTTKVTDEDTRILLRIEIVRFMRQSGDLQQVKSLMIDTLFATLFETDAWNVSTLSNMAQALYQIGEKDQAAATMNDALKEAEKIVPGIQNFYIFSNLTAALLQIGNHTETMQQLERASTAARAMNTPKDRCQALVQLLPYVPQETLGREVREILEIARKIGDSDIRIQIFANVAPYLKENELLTVLDEALQLAKSMKEEFSFWMPESTRPDVFAFLAQNDPNFLLTQIQEIAPRILQAQNNGLPIPPAVIRWAELTTQARSGTGRAARWLNKHIEQLVKEDDTGLALAWINTATALLPVLQGELEMSIALGNRRVELAYRQSQDQRYLQYFLTREEQINAFLALMLGGQTERDTGAIWALHYIGMGGVGKTTIIRYIIASIAPQYRMLTSRVDFDYLNPDYPSRRPGQLLIELAKELQLRSTNQAHEDAFRSFQQHVIHYHEVLSSATNVADPLASLRHPEFQLVIQSFCDFLNAFQQPVVLILDTCEELAKFHPPGAAPPNLQATFTMLESIHAILPSVRVIFAGRRFLTQGGAGWSLDEQHIQEGQSLLQEQKDYLLLHEIRGFTETEALHFLTSIKQLTLSSELQQAILRRSLETGAPTAINYVPPREVEEGTRYNPFDLALYADWIREDPKVTPDIINQGKTDPYVEMRIINRIRRDDVLRLLPAAILLRRFDKAMLRLAFDGNDTAFSEVYREFGNLEWITYQSEGASDFWEIDRNLHPRLLEYYKHPDRRWSLDQAQQRLAAGLSTLIEDSPLTQLQADHIEAAIKLLPEEDAVTLWDSLAQRITDAGDWSRARTFTERLLDNDAPVVSEQHPARASVRATFISAMLHEQPELPVTAFWNEVMQTASAHPDPDVRQWLQQRAIIGRIAAMCRTQTVPSDDQLAEFWNVCDHVSHTPGMREDANIARIEQFAGSLCAAFEALLELIELQDRQTLIALPDLIPLLSMMQAQRNLSLEVRTFASMLMGKVMALHERWRDTIVLHARWRDASDWFELACSMLPQIDTQLHNQRWADWRMPDLLHDRVRLEALHAIPRHLLTISRDTRQIWQQEAIERLPAIDADRLISYTLTLRLAHEVVPRKVLDELAAHDSYMPERQPECIAHRAIPPLFATRALALLALGNADEALRVVDERIQAVTKTRTDRENIVRAAENVKIHIIRRMRATHRFRPFIEQYTLLHTGEDQTMIWPTLALGTAADRQLIPSLINVSGLSYIHAWWRSCRPTEASPGIDMLNKLRRDGLFTDELSASASFEQISLALDLHEAQLLSGRKPENETVFDMDVWLEAHPTQVEQAVRLWLRAVVLDKAPETSLQRRARLQTFGSPWIAELALDEGELLALRLPERARLLLESAITLFASTETQQFRTALRLAEEEALRLQHNYIETEHLLLGLIREREGVAAKVLTNMGVELKKVREAVEFIVGRGNRIVVGEIGLTPRSRKVIELAGDEARRLNHHYIGTEHLLLGLVREGEGIAVGILESLGVNLEKVRTQTTQVLSQSGAHEQEIAKLSQISNIEQTNNHYIYAAISNICSIIASIRSAENNNKALQALKNRLQLAYARLSESSSFKWLAWNELLATPPDANPLLKTIWQGWLERLLNCTFWLEVPDNKDIEPFSDLRDWLKSQYGARLPDELNLPRTWGTLQGDINLTALENATRAEVSNLVSPIARSISTSLLSLVALSLVPILIIVGIVIAFLTVKVPVVWKNLEMSIGSFSPCPQPSCNLGSLDTGSLLILCASLLIPLFVTGAYTIARRQLRSIRANLAAQSSLKLTLSIHSGPYSGPGDGSLLVGINMIQRPTALRLALPPRLSLQPEKPIVSIEHQIPEAQDYSSMASALSTTIREEFVSLQKRLGEQKLPVRLDIASGLQDIPWEALFTLALPTTSQALWSESFQFWRQSLPPSPPAFHEAGGHTVVLSSPNWHRVICNAWGQSTAIYPTSSLQEIQNALQEKPTHIKILHVICTPLFSASGRLLQIESSTGKIAIEQTESNDNVDSPIRLEDLPFVLANLVVIQAEPVETIERQNIERQQTADLRSCAAIAFSAGATTVVMLPTLPPLLTEHILRRLATCYEGQTLPHRQRILDAISDIRSLIATWNSLGDAEFTTQEIVSDAQLELALDVCVFTREPIP